MLSVFQEEKNMKNNIEHFPQCKNCRHLSKTYFFRGSALRDIDYVCSMRYSFESDCKFWELDDNAEQTGQGFKDMLIEMKEKLSNIESILLAEEKKNAPQ